VFCWWAEACDRACDPAKIVICITQRPFQKATDRCTTSAFYLCEVLRGKTRPRLAVCVALKSGRRGSISSPRSISMGATAARRAQHYVLVNGGVVTCAAASNWTSKYIQSLLGNDALAAVAGTAVLYAFVFAAAATNLRGRKRAIERPAAKELATPIALSSILSHPIGSAFERFMHARYLAAPASTPSVGAATAIASSVTGSSAWWVPMLVGCGYWWLWFVIRLLAFELAFDGLFYCAHRLVHAAPRFCEQA
jgi:hypothetical protein